MAKTYRQKVLEFQKEKDTGIRKENSWLALAGLTNLKEGVNQVGSDSSCDILLPARAPAFVGTFEFDGKSVSFQAAEGQTIDINGASMDKANLKSSKDATPSYLTLKNMRMVVHEYSGGFGIRLWDNEREERRTHPPRKWFPVHEAYRFLATFTRFEQPIPALLPNVFGDVEEWFLTGRATFNFDGQDFSLDTTDARGNTLFIQFKDLTSRKNTYPSGRYLYTEPVQDDKVIVDFNLAYNPPCVFTSYATCAFAPKQNELPLMIEVGEIYTS